jgi:carbon monoxide dehydrogenase subunit G
MGTVEQKDLNWIERAPVSFSGSATTTASPGAVFAILADHERWPEWFPVIKKTVVLGPAREGVGMRRLTTLPGGKVEELIIAWDPGERWAFTGTAVSPAIVHALVEDCRIEPAGSGTRVNYTMYLDPVAPLRPFMKLIKGLMGKQLDKGMRALAARAEGR